MYLSGDASGISPKYANKLKDILTALNIAEDIETLITVPGFKLHELKGNRRGEWSIYVTGNRRVTFKFEDGYAYDVDLEDYH